MSWPTADGTKFLLGKGAVYVAELDTTLWTHKGEEFMGNTDDFAMGGNVETKDRGSSVEPTVLTLASTPTRRSMDLSITLNEYKKAALAKMFMATASVLAQAPGSFTGPDQNFTPDPTLAAYAWPNMLGKTFEHKTIRNWKSTSPALVIKAGTTTAVENTDYIVDYRGGRIYIVPTSILTGAMKIDSGGYLADTGDLIEMGSGPSYFQVRFVGNAASGPNWEAVLWKVMLQPDGSAPFISEDYGSFKLKGTIIGDTTKGSVAGLAPFGKLMLRN